MKKVVTLCALFIFAFSLCSFGQKRNRHAKKGRDQTPTPAQLMAFKTQYTKMLGDSLSIPKEKRDTVAALELQFLLKQMSINQDKTLSKEDKEVHVGMLENDKYMHLGPILTVDELERLESFEARQKKRQADQEKERQDQMNQQSEQRRNSNRGYGGYGGGYGGYGGGYNGY